MQEKKKNRKNILEKLKKRKIDKRKHKFAWEREVKKKKIETDIFRGKGRKTRNKKKQNLVLEKEQKRKIYLY